MDATSFTRLATNFGDWCERNSDANSPFARLFSTLFLWRRQLGKLELKGLSTAGAAAHRLVDEHIAAITSGISAPDTRSLERTSWVNVALNPFPELFAPVGVVRSSRVRTHSSASALPIARSTLRTGTRLGLILRCRRWDAWSRHVWGTRQQCGIGRDGVAAETRSIRTGNESARSPGSNRRPAMRPTPIVLK